MPLINRHEPRISPRISGPLIWSLRACSANARPAWFGRSALTNKSRA